MANTNDFLGTGWAFPPTFIKGEGDGVQMVSDFEDIKQSLGILLRTLLGERVMEPNYGAALEQLLFDPMNDALLSLVRSKIADSILIYESRIVLETIRIDANQAEGVLHIMLDFTVTSENTRYNLVFPFYLNEATNISQ